MFLRRCDQVNDGFYAKAKLARKSPGQACFLDLKKHDTLNHCVPGETIVNRFRCRIIDELMTDYLSDMIDISIF